jgi:hypothetical protein
MNEKEKKLRDHRLIEASHKKYSGVTGKFGLIARFLGSPMISQHQGGLYHDTNYLEDPYALPKENENFSWNPAMDQDEIPYMEIREDPTAEPTEGAWRSERNATIPQVSLLNLGWHFDGLSRGMHLEIKMLLDSKEITVQYQGYAVYKESGGELEIFAPGEWETKIEQLYAQAKKKSEVAKIEEKQEIMEQAKADKKSWLQQMKERWGLDV